MSGGEIAFPRGKGKVPSDSDTRDKPKKRKKGIPSDSLFDERRKYADEFSAKADRGKAKRVKRNKKANIEDEDDADDTTEVVIERTTVASLSAGTTILGCLTKITDLDLTFCVPGGILVSVPLFHISAAYSKMVESFMNGESKTPPMKPQSMFVIGQVLPVRIMEKDSTDGRPSSGHTKIIGSINPVDVYEDVIPSSLESFGSEMIMSASVESLEDHGYVMDLGLGKRMKGFLPIKKAGSLLAELKLKRLPIGCVLLTATVSCSGSTVTLTGKETEIQSKLITGDDALLTPSVANPGCRLQAIIMDIKDNGLKIVAGNELKGFIHRDHLKSEFDLTKTNYEIGQSVIMTVFYVHPMTKHVVGTLRNVLDRKTLMSKLSDYKIGQMIKSATVVHVEDGGHLILKSGKAKLRATFNQLKDDFIEESQVRTEFPVGSKWDSRVQVISFLDSCLRVSLKPSQVNQATSDKELTQLNVGDVAIGKVTGLTEKGLYLSIGYRLSAFIRRIHLVDSPSVTNFDRLFKLGQPVKVRLLKIDRESDPPFINATAKKTIVGAKNIITDVKEATIGQVTFGVIVLINKFGLLVEFFNGVTGFIRQELVSQAYPKTREDQFIVGQVVKVKVMSVEADHGKISLSFAEQDMNNQSVTTKTIHQGDKDRSTNPSFQAGSIVHVKVVKYSVLDAGLVVRLMVSEQSDLKVSNVFGFVPVHHLTDAESTCPKHVDKLYGYGKVVSGRILRVELKRDRHYEAIPDGQDVIFMVTLKPSLVAEEVKSWTDMDKIRRGMTTLGVVSQVTKGRGRLVEFVGGLRGSLSFADIKRHKSVNIGKLVAVKVASVDVDKRDIRLTLIDFDLLTFDGQSDLTQKVTLLSDGQTDDEDDDDDVIDLTHHHRRRRTTSTSSNISFDQLPVLEYKVDVNPDKITLVDADDEAGSNEVADDHYEDDPEEVVDAESDLKTQDTVKSAKERESDLRRKEEDLSNRDKIPETLEEHERLVVSHPNSSYHWLRYMSFLLDKGRPDDCRSVGEKALKVMGFGQEEERFNVFIALINLEHLHGTPESLEDIIDRALAVNDRLRVYVHVANMFLEAGKVDEARAVHEVILKKFKNDPTSWTSFGHFYYKTGKPDQAMSLLERSFDSVDDSHHLDMISKFAQFEFKLGRIEKGKTLFESLLTNFPKRSDLWSVYLAHLVKFGGGRDVASVRATFERAINSGIKKVTPIIKKYIDFEESIGHDLTNLTRLKERIAC